MNDIKVMIENVIPDCKVSKLFRLEPDVLMNNSVIKTTSYLLHQMLNEILLILR